MSDTEAKSAPRVDLQQLERTLQASIKLMKRGRREMERMRRRSSRHEPTGQGHSAS